MTFPDSNVQKHDHLGFPCQVTQAREQFADSIDQAVEWATHDPRGANRRIGKALLDLRIRMSHMILSLEVANASLPEDTDSDNSRAILTLAEEYATKTADLFDRLAGHVLVVMEQTEAAELPQ
jgi:hypothetical protein